jgi:hypothetical protein
MNKMDSLLESHDFKNTWVKGWPKPLRTCALTRGGTNTTKAASHAARVESTTGIGSDMESVAVGERLV